MVPRRHVEVNQSVARTERAQNKLRRRFGARRVCPGCAHVHGHPIIAASEAAAQWHSRHSTNSSRAGLRGVWFLDSTESGSGVLSRGMQSRNRVDESLGRTGSNESGNLQASWRDDIFRCAGVFILSRAILAVYVWLTGQHFRCAGPRCTDRAFFPDNILLNGMFQWDALQYRTLAETGYVTGSGFETTAPFFPGFPLAARLLGKVVGSPLAGGIIVNWVAAIVGAVFLSQLVRRTLRRGDSGTATQASLVWLLGPLSFFFTVFLSESMFACLAVVTLWGASTGRAWVFALAGAGAAFTRNSGVLVIVAGMVLVWEQRGLRTMLTARWLLALGAAALGFIAFLAMQYAAFGNAFEWVEAQRRWNRYLVWPATTLRDDWIGFPTLNPTRRSVDAMYRSQEVLAAVITLPLFFVRRRAGIPYALAGLGLVLWLLPLLSHSLISYARYQAANVYLVIALAWVLSRWPTARAVGWWALGLVFAWYASTYPFGVWAT